jgi:hypothetical protein
MYYQRKILFLILLLSTLLPPSLKAQNSNRNQGLQAQEQEQDYNEDPLFYDSTQTSNEEEIYADEEYTNEFAEGTDNRTVISPVEEPLQQKDRSIADAQWQELSNDPAFRYEEPKPKVEEQSSSAWLRFFEAVFRFLESGGGKILLISLVALLIIYLIIRAIQLKGNIFFARKDKKLSNGEEDELSDHFIPDSWEKVIEDAAKAGNYRLAVRHSYRYLLSLLQDRELIRYQTAKTNYQYAYELTGTRIHQPFLQLTRGYEYAWYGGFPIAKERFEAYYQQIDNIKKDLL